MTAAKIVILVGSTSDMQFAKRVQSFLQEAGFLIDCEYRLDSAHRNVEKLINDLKNYERSNARIVYITIAGLSDALSGVVAGYAKSPVIACPPDLEKHGLQKAFSTMMTPKGIAVTMVSQPENAAFAAVKILALSDPSLRKRVSEYTDKMRDAVANADKEMRAKEGHTRAEPIKHVKQGEP